MLSACDGSFDNSTGPTIALAAGRPTALYLTCDQSVTEGTPIHCSLFKTGGNGKPVVASWSAPGQSGSVKLSGSTPVPFDVPTVDDGDVNGNRTISVVAKSSTASDAASVTVLDNDVPPVVTPPVVTPPEPPAPPPVVTPPPPGDVPSPSLAGQAPIASNFDPMTELQTSALPDSGAPDLGAFRFMCGPGQVSRDDPIVYPGQPGKSHLHQYFGNTLANANSTYGSLRTTGQSTCMSEVNRSGYWVPALLDGKGNVIRPDTVSIYYKRWPDTDFHCNSQGGYPTKFNVEGADCLTLPSGLRFIYGYNMLNPAQSPTGAVQFMCEAQLANYETMTQALDRCRANPTGPQHFIARIEAPNCWDGKRLDSADHRSHVAYASYGGDATGMGGWGYLRCPSTHPHVIPTFTMTIQYTIAPGDDTTLWRFSSDEMMNTAPGVTFHGDWFGAWDPTVQAMWTDNCINKDLSCQSGNLGNGYGMKNTFGPIGITVMANPRLVAVSSIP
jgi:hypothetical protein